LSKYGIIGRGIRGFYYSSDELEVFVSRKTIWRKSTRDTKKELPPRKVGSVFESLRGKEASEKSLIGLH